MKLSHGEIKKRAYTDLANLYTSYFNKGTIPNNERFMLDQIAETFAALMMEIQELREEVRQMKH